MILKGIDDNVKVVDIIKALSNISEPTSYEISLYTVSYPEGTQIIPANYYEIIRLSDTPSISFIK